MHLCTLSSPEGAGLPDAGPPVANEKLLWAAVKGTAQLSSADASRERDLDIVRYSDISGKAENVDLIYRQVIVKSKALQEGSQIKMF